MNSPPPPYRASSRQRREECRIYPARVVDGSDHHRFCDRSAAAPHPFPRDGGRHRRVWAARPRSPHDPVLCNTCRHSSTVVLHKNEPAPRTHGTTSPLHRFSIILLEQQPTVTAGPSTAHPIPRPCPSPAGPHETALSHNPHIPQSPQRPQKSTEQKKTKKQRGSSPAFLDVKLVLADPFVELGPDRVRDLRRCIHDIA